MKKAFEKFAKLNYDLDDFYCIRFMSDKVYLQGNASEKRVEKYQALGFKFEFDSDNKWIDAKLLMDDLSIVITLVLP